MMNYPLHDTEFLKELFNRKERTVYVRATALTLDEKPIEYIEGKATGGSINIDGTSRVRRTCSLTLVAQEVNINDFYWGLKNKFKLEVGLLNNINKKYPDIIWFKLGLYVITSFNVSRTTNNYTINISGKDKMCLLNGDLAGALPHTTDFGIEEYYDAETNVTTYTSIPIRRIIQESVLNFGNELPQNIIINDLEDAGLELLEYRGDRPIYMFREVNSDSFLNMTINGSLTCYVDGVSTTVSDSTKIKYDNLVNLSEDSELPTLITFSTAANKRYTVAKFEYGSIPGYRLTDLVFAGDLIANVGETLTSMLDKIVNMLGEFEYFYNLDGKFVFQKKLTYIDVYWNNVEKNTDEVYANAAVNKSIPMWSFIDGQLISAFLNTPNLLNLRNDFAVWGKKKTTSGSELDIHMRYAIDTKPTDYFSLIDNQWYSTTGEDFVDWRELIYKMALDYRHFYHDDDFLYRVSSSNIKPGEEISLYPAGRTGYEQYYIDMEGFWRQLYNPKPNVLKFKNMEAEDFRNDNISNAEYTKKDAYIKYGLIRGTKEVLELTDPFNVYVIIDGVLKPFIQGYCFLDKNVNYQYKTIGGLLNNTKDIGSDKLESFLLNESLKSFYVENTLDLYEKLHRRLLDKTEQVFFRVYKYSNGEISNDSIRYIDAKYQEALDNNLPMYIFSKEYNKFSKLPEEIQQLYWDGTQFRKDLTYKLYNNLGLETEKTVSNKINYYTAYYEFNDNGWSKEVTDNPENLLFWFDFIDPEEADLAKYSVKAVGTRSKALNDNDVKSIYYREIPKTIFLTGIETYEHLPGYTYVQLQGTMENLFTISSKGKSAQEAIEDLLYKYSYCIESTNITALPVYHLEPNTRVLIRDLENGIDGEYAVSKITIPLAYNGTMSLTATKVVSNITF